MRIVAPPGAGSILAIAAHPEDIERWCAGTLARAADAGATVRLLLVTSGYKGSAVQLLGIAEVAFLRQPDGEVENARALRADLVAAIRRWRPFALFTHDPERPQPPYLAHRAVGRAALDAAYPLARDPLAFSEQGRAGLAPHALREVWLFASDAADASVDIAPTFERKLAARLEHRSQTADPAELRARWRERAAAIGATAGVALVEALTILHLGDD